MRYSRAFLPLAARRVAFLPVTRRVADGSGAPIPRSAHSSVTDSVEISLSTVRDSAPSPITLSFSFTVQILPGRTVPQFDGLIQFPNSTPVPVTPDQADVAQAPFSLSKNCLDLQ